MNITTEIQDTDTQTFCDDCTGAMTPGGHYDLGGLGFAFSRDNGPADYDEVDR